MKDMVVDVHAGGGCDERPGAVAVDDPVTPLNDLRRLLDATIALVLCERLDPDTIMDVRDTLDSDWPAHRVVSVRLDVVDLASEVCLESWLFNSTKTTTVGSGDAPPATRLDASTGDAAPATRLDANGVQTSPALDASSVQSVMMAMKNYMLWACGCAASTDRIHASRCRVTVTPDTCAAKFARTPYRRAFKTVVVPSGSLAISVATSTALLPPDAPSGGRKRASPVLDEAGGHEKDDEEGVDDNSDRGSTSESAAARTRPPLSPLSMARSAASGVTESYFHGTTGLPVVSSPDPRRAQQRFFEPATKRAMFTAPLSTSTTPSMIGCTSNSEPIPIRTGSSSNSLSSNSQSPPPLTAVTIAAAAAAATVTVAVGSSGAGSARVTTPLLSPPLLLARPMASPSSSFSSSPLVGSWEESILTGRMGSIPVEHVSGFVAEIGACGNGKCPDHVSIPFTALFYRPPNERMPSPYVASIPMANVAPDSLHPGLYRIPQKGIIQLIVFNPQKTVIKVFVVPYDLTDMPPRSKTFLRQRTLTRQTPHSLVYATHLKFVRSKKHYYLHSEIRVVFSHRSPDGSAGVDVLTDAPQPRFTSLVDADVARMFPRKL